MDDDCCGGFTVDTTVGEASITLHAHAMLTPEVLDTFLTRMTRRAAAADTARFKAVRQVVNAPDPQ